MEPLNKFQILTRFLTPESSIGLDPNTVAQELTISPEACDKALQRLRRDFRETVKGPVAGTLENPDQESIREEMGQLQRALI